MRQDLTEYELELLGILQEECAEVIQIISKIRRFGLNDWHPDDPEQVTNKTKLTNEIGDFVGIVEMLREQQLFDAGDIDVAAQNKMRKVLLFLKSKP